MWDLRGFCWRIIDGVLLEVEGRKKFGKKLRNIKIKK